MKLHSIKYTKKEAKERWESIPEPAVIEEDRFPWGFELDFNDDTLEKVPGVAELDAGAKVKLAATGFVKRKNVNESQEDSTTNITIQITKIGVADVDDFDSAFKEASD
jgi:hypothetical protein